MPEVASRSFDEKNASHKVHGLVRAGRDERPFRETPITLLLETYLQYLEMRGFAESTLRVRRIYLTMFVSWCFKGETHHPREVTKALLERYQRFLFQYRKKDGQPLAVTSQYSRLAPLKVWFKWLAKRKDITCDPSVELDLPRVGYKLPRVFTKEETELVLQQPNLKDALGRRDRTILEVFYSTGIRRMELVSLKLYDIDQKNGLMTIHEGKGKRDRVVPIGERALFWLGRYLAEVRPSIAKKPDNSIVFLTANGNPFSPNHLSLLARRYGNAANIGKGGACHIFRHTMATLMLEGGADIRYIQAMLGHVRLDTTQIYTHVSIRMLKEIHTATHPAARLCDPGITIESSGAVSAQKEI